MKLNFWQLVGLVVLVFALVLIARRKTADQPVPSTAPQTIPSTEMPR